MNLVQFLEYAGTAVGINVVIGFLLSFVVEWFPRYEGLAPRWKRLVVAVLSFVIPVVSVVALWVMGEVQLSYNVVWVALSAGFAAFFGSQVAHGRNLRARPVEPMSFSEEGEMLFGKESE